jgi:hypothetical protein
VPKKRELKTLEHFLFLSFRIMLLLDIDAVTLDKYLAKKKIVVRITIEITSLF